MSEELETEAAETTGPATGSGELNVEELRRRLAEQEGSSRPHEYVRSLVMLAEALPRGAEKVELLLKAADLYANKFMNQAEAVKLTRQTPPPSSSWNRCTKSVVIGKSSSR
jgi:hypothetical protein